MKRAMPELKQPRARDYGAAHRRLVSSFDDVRASYGYVDGPFGRVFIARTIVGVCRVSFQLEEDAIVAGLEARQLLPESDPGKVDRERHWLEAYFAGETRRVALDVDLRGITEFQRRVLEAARRIPFGEVESYSRVAQRIRNPRACRAVGNALGKNPIAIVIPCHRVIAADGGLGGYTGGTHIKRILMDIEGIAHEGENA